MSRIGKKPIEIPQGVEVKLEGGNVVKVKGPKGQLERKIHHTVKLSMENGSVHVTPGTTANADRRFHGLSRTLIANMVEGVSKGFERSLTLVGVGYRAVAKGKGLTLSLGYSHPIEYDPPAGIDCKVDKQTTVILSSANKELLGQEAAKIRSFRKPEPYHGKGVRYTDERIVTKVGKAAGKK